MKTRVIKKKAMRRTAKKVSIKKSKPIKPLLQDGEPEKIPIDKIDLSPLNYRKYYSETDLQEFAKELAIHGIISSLTVRPATDGRYELVVGERRWRAAKIAKLKEAPAIIAPLSDDEVIEIQLAENLQREDPHPMHEAQGIGQLQKKRKSIDEISKRLGKSKAFVYSRIKLLALIEPIQEMFLADKISITEATEIATISADSQQEFFDEHCANWKEQESFHLFNLKYILDRFKYDLTRAPFNIKDKNLLEDIGACSRCPFNTATLKTLFPDEAKEAVCTNRNCYQKKCTAHFVKTVSKAFEEHQPEALLFYNNPSEELISALESIPGANELPRFARYEVTSFAPPELPDKEDYTNEDEEDSETPAFDETGYNEAMDEYNSELEEYKRLLQSGEVKKGLFISGGKIEMIPFTFERSSTSNTYKSNVTAKQVQEAMKQGEATPDLLRQEIERINAREQRQQELDQEKIYEQIHKSFSEKLADVSNNGDMTTADLVAARFLIYYNLDYSAKYQVEEVLSIKGDEQKQNLFDVFANLTEQQHSYLIRKAILGKHESKLPTHFVSQFMYKTAGAAGIDIAAIESEQQQKAAARQERQKERVEQLEKEIKKLESVQETADCEE